MVTLPPVVPTVARTTSSGVSSKAMQLERRIDGNRHGAFSRLLQHARCAHNAIRADRDDLRSRLGKCVHSERDRLTRDTANLWIWIGTANPDDVRANRSIGRICHVKTQCLSRADG